ncbi:hypothetical protein F5X99DRAFT_396908 [Biscogniauxia marginata]|nr:hypothetical protein F5X99DRAFT_396908 [Biscogniauxia marginata]
MAQHVSLRQVRESPNRNDIFSILNEYLQPDNPTSAAKAAAAIAALPADPSDTEKTWDEGFFWNFWKDIIQVAEQLPHDHPGQDKIVAFLRELTLLPDTGVTVWDHRVWSGLPILGAAIREHLNGPRTSSSEDEQSQINQQWVSFHAFEARLVHTGVSHSETTAIWMLRTALEEEIVTDNTKGFDRDLMTAAVHIIYAGPVLVNLLAARPDPALDASEQRVLRGGALFHGRSGLVRERWDFWTARFRELAGKTTMEEAKALALRAARLMEVWTQNRLKSG